MKRIYPEDARNHKDLEAFLDVWPDDIADEITIKEEADGYQVTLTSGAARVGFGFDQRDLKAYLHIREARAALTAQKESI